MGLTAVIFSEKNGEDESAFLRGYSAPRKKGDTKGNVIKLSSTLMCPL